MSDDSSSWAPFGPGGEPDPPPRRSAEPADPGAATPEPPSAPEPVPAAPPSPPVEEPPAPAEPPSPVEAPSPPAFHPPAAPVSGGFLTPEAPRPASSRPLTWPAPAPVPPPPAPALPPPGETPSWPAPSWPPPAPPTGQVGPYPQRPGGRVPGNATAAFVLGLAGIFICPLVGSVAAIALGVSARREIEADPSLGGRGLAGWGLGLGIAGLAWAAFLLFVVFGLSVY